jgi:tyrosinase
MQSAPNPKDPRQSSPPVPEMVGATSAPFDIGPTTTQISLTMHPPTGPALLRTGSTEKQVYLLVENVTCNRPSPGYDVYLNVPPGDEPQQHPELHAGGLGMFGLIEASRASGQHGGNGLKFKLDVTDLFARLPLLKGWDKQNLRMSLVPEPWDAPVPKVQVGRVSLYFQ